MAFAHTNTPVLASAANATVAGAYGSNVTVGHLLCGTSSNSGTGTTCTVTDTVGTSYTVTPILNPTGLTTVAFYGVAAASGANTVTAVWSGGAPAANSTLVAEEFSGGSATPFDVQVSATGSTGSLSAGNITPTGANELIFVAGGKLAATGAGAGAGYTGAQSVTGTTLASETQYQIQTTLTTVATAFSGSTVPNWACYAIAFKVASGGGGSLGELTLLGAG